jgi:hypothetical protein
VVVEATLGEPLQGCVVQGTDLEIGVQPQREGHRCGAAGQLLHRGGDRQGRGVQLVAQLQRKGEGVVGQGGLAVAEAELHAGAALERLELPGQIPGKAVLGHGKAALGQLQLIAGEVAADGEQHRDAATHAVGGIRKALLVEIEALMAIGPPAGDQPTSLRHQPQLIAAGGGEPPVGVGGVEALEHQWAQRLYLRMHQMARTPSRQPIFLPSS